MMEWIDHRMTEHQMNKVQIKPAVVPAAPAPRVEQVETTEPSCAESFDEKEETDCQGRPLPEGLQQKTKSKNRKKNKLNSLMNPSCNPWRPPSVQPSFMQTVTPYYCDCTRCYEYQQKPKVIYLSTAGGRSFAAVRNDLTSFFEKILDAPKPSQRKRKDQLGLCKVILELCTVEITAMLFIVEYYGLSRSEALCGSADLFSRNQSSHGKVASLDYSR